MTPEASHLIGLNLNTMRDGKAPGPDNVQIRFLKLLDDDGING